MELFIAPEFLRGLLYALLGVGFWIGGVVVAYLVWRHYRGEGRAR